MANLAMQKRSIQRFGIYRAMQEYRRYQSLAHFVPLQQSTRIDKNA